MDYTVTRMSRASATEISNWSYESPYNFYNMGGTEDAISELLSGNYFLVTGEQQQTVGFFCVGPAAQVPLGHQFGAYADKNAIDVGLGMRPELTGRGLGVDFLSFVLNYCESQYPAEKPRLTVAAFNRRAITLYQKLGFVGRCRFPATDVEFLIMERPSVDEHSSLFIK